MNLGSLDFSRYANELVQQRYGCEHIEPEVIRELELDVANRVEYLIEAAIINKIPEQAMEEFVNILDSDDEVKQVAFIQRYIPRIDILITEIMLGFKKSYLGIQ